MYPKYAGELRISNILMSIILVASLTSYPPSCNLLPNAKTNFCMHCSYKVVQEKRNLFILHLCLRETTNYNRSSTYQLQKSATEHFSICHGLNF
jgi:hypothetical protein